MTNNPVMKITDEQIAEIEAYADQPGLEDREAAQLYIGELRALISRMRASERDAGRYQWLRKNVCMGCPSPEGSQYTDAYLVVTGYGYEESGDLTDDAIDTAMKGDQE